MFENCSVGRIWPAAGSLDNPILKSLNKILKYVQLDTYQETFHHSPSDSYICEELSFKQTPALNSHLRVSRTLQKPASRTWCTAAEQIPTSGHVRLCRVELYKLRCLQCGY